MAYKEKRLNNKDDVQALYNALGSAPERKKSAAKKPASNKRETTKRAGSSK